MIKRLTPKLFLPSNDTSNLLYNVRLVNRTRNVQHFGTAFGRYWSDLVDDGNLLPVYYGGDR